MKKYPSQERLKELFDYDPDGFLVWKYRSNVAAHINARFTGVRSGSFFVDGKGEYRNNVSIDGQGYRSCALVWIWHNGAIPDGFDVRQKPETESNKICSLWIERKNSRRGVRHANRAHKGYVGVSKRGKSFRAQLNKIKLGTFSSEIAAAAAVDAKRRELNPQETIFNLDFEFDFEPYRTKKTGRPKTKGDAF